MNDILKLDAGQFLKDRKEVLDLRSEVSKLPELAKITALLPADRAHLAMLAHQVYNRVRPANFRNTQQRSWWTTNQNQM